MRQSKAFRAGIHRLTGLATLNRVAQWQEKPRKSWVGHARSLGLFKLLQVKRSRIKIAVKRPVGYERVR